MSNCSIGALNWIYEGRPTWSKGDWAIGPEALETADTKEYTRSESVDPIDTQLGIEFDSPRPVDTVFIGYHNGTDSSKFRLLAGPPPIIEDFSTYVSGQIPEGFSFECNLARTYWDAAGVLRYVGPNVPRYAYHPTSHEFLGFQAEPEGTYLPVHSEDFRDWTADGATVTSNSDIAPDGTSTADRIVETTATSVHGRTHAVTWNPFTFHRVAWFAKNSTLSWQCLRIYDGSSSWWVFFNASTGQVGHTTAGVTTRVEELSNGWFRVCVQFQASAGAGSGLVGLYTARSDGGDATPSYAGNTGNRIIAWGFTVNTGSNGNAVPDSYVPTISSTVVRPAESGFYREDMADYYGTSGLTAVVGFRPVFIPGSGTNFITPFIIWDETFNNRIRIGYGDTGYNAGSIGSPSSFTMASVGTTSVSAENVIGLSYDADEAYFQQAGGSLFTSSSSSLPNAPRLEVGSVARPVFISKFAVFSGKMTAENFTTVVNDFSQADTLAPAVIPWTDLVPTTNIPDSNGRTYFGRNSSGKIPTNERDSRGVCRIVFLDQEVVSDNYTLQIKDASNPAGYFQFSILWLGKSERPELGVEPGFSMINVEETKRKRSLGGVFYGRRQWQRKRVAGALRQQHQDFALPFYQELGRMVGTDRPLLFSLYPGTAGINEDRFTILGVLEDPTPLESEQYIYWGWPFAIVQL